VRSHLLQAAVLCLPVLRFKIVLFLCELVLFVRSNLSQAAVLCLPVLRFKIVLFLCELV
jgi:hypothetical protein